jgi:hypothetical protein
MSASGTAIRAAGQERRRIEDSGAELGMGDDGQATMMEAGTTAIK